MPKRSTREFLLEGVLIVASILVAFALDASWDRYQESRAEERILNELLAEFRDGAGRIEGSIDELEVALAASAELLNSVGPTAPPLSADRARALLHDVLYANTLEVPSSVLASITTSGEIRLIASEQLRQDLSAWPALLADVRENHDWHRQATDEVFIPEISAHVPVRDLVRELLVQNLGGSSELLEESGFEVDAMPLQRSPRFESLLAWRTARQSATLAESRLLLDAARRTISQLEAELGADAS